MHKESDTDRQDVGVDISSDTEVHGDIVGGNKITRTENRSYFTLIGTGTAIVIGFFVLTYLVLSQSLVLPYAIQPPKPTLPAFAPAMPNETLLVIVDFDDRSAGLFSGIDPAQRIYKLVSEKLPSGDPKLRVEQYHPAVKDTSAARQLLKTYGATILIWGWYDKLGAEPNIELDQEKISMQDPALPEFSLATPETFAIRFTQEIPAQAAYVTLFSLGMMQVNRGARDRAREYMSQAIASTATASSGSVNPWEALMVRGNIFFRDAKYDLALADYSAALELNPRGVRDLYNNRGVTYLLQQNYPAAVSDISNAIAIDPDFEYAYLDRGNAYLGQGNLAAAIADFTKAIELNPNFIYAYGNRGTVESIQGNYTAAISDYSKAIEIDPNFAKAYTGRGNVYADLHKFSDAVSNYQKSLSLNPDSYTYCVLGITYTKMGDFPSAVSALEQGVKIAATSENPWCNRALDNARKGTPTP